MDTELLNPLYPIANKSRKTRLLKRRSTDTLETLDTIEKQAMLETDGDAAKWRSSASEENAECTGDHGNQKDITPRKRCKWSLNEENSHEQKDVPFDENNQQLSKSESTTTMEFQESSLNQWDIKFEKIFDDLESRIKRIYIKDKLQK